MPPPASGRGVTHAASFSREPRKDSSGGEAGPMSIAGAALDLAAHVDAHVGGDPVEPGAHAGPALESLGIPPRPDHRLLDGVLGFEPRAEHPVAVPGQLAAEGLDVGELNGTADHHGPEMVPAGLRRANRPSGVRRIPAPILIARLRSRRRAAAEAGVSPPGRTSGERPARSSTPSVEAAESFSWQPLLRPDAPVGAVAALRRRCA